MKKIILVFMILFVTLLVACKGGIDASYIEMKDALELVGMEDIQKILCKNAENEIDKNESIKRKTDLYKSDDTRFMAFSNNSVKDDEGNSYPYSFMISGKLVDGEDRNYTFVIVLGYESSKDFSEGIYKALYYQIRGKELENSINHLAPENDFRKNIDKLDEKIDEIEKNNENNEKNDAE